MAELRSFQWTNFGRSTLAANITAEATSLQVQGGDASKFPSPGVDEIFSLIVSSASDPFVFEVMYCTSRSGSTLTVERAKESTTARAWLAGDTVIHSVTAGFFEQLTFPASAPSAVTLSGVEGDGVVELTWTESVPSSGDEIESYKVFKSVNSGSYTLIATVDADSPREYDDEDYDVAALNNYYVVATAILGGDSAASNILPFGGLDYFPVVTVPTALDEQGGKWVVSQPGTADLRLESTNANNSYLPLLPVKEKPTGKYYYEVYVENALSSPPNTNAGLHTGFTTWAAAIIPSIDSSLGAGTDGLTYYDGYAGSTSGRIQEGDGTFDFSNVDRIQTGDTMNVAIDFDNDKVWFGRNGVWQGSGTQNPVTGDGGYWPTDTTWNGGVTNRPAIFTYGPWQGADYDIFDSEGEIVQMRFSEDYWQYTPPSGFGNEFKFYARVPGVPSSGAAFAANAATEAHIDNVAPAIALVNQNNSAVAIHPQVRAATSRNSGKYYWEVMIIAAGEPNTQEWGLVPDSTSWDGRVGTMGHGVGIDDTGRINADGSPDGAGYGTTDWFDTIDARTQAAVSAGDVLMFAVDLDANRMWFGANGVWFNSGAPAAGTGGIALSSGSDWRPALTIYSGGVKCIFNCGGNTFEHDAPTGFEAWEKST